MLYHFDAKKATQAAAVLLRYENGKMEHMRLLKLLYIADREAIREVGSPISLSKSVAMEHGPLSSDVYDLINGVRTDEGQWSNFIRKHGINLELMDDPGRGKLSAYEIDKLNEVSQRYEHLPSWELAEETHNFPEWEKNKPPKGSSRLIPLGAILDALNLADRKDEIIADLQEKAAADQFFAESLQG